MFGWSNTTSGYRLAMERLLGRAPSEEELQETLPEETEEEAEEEKSST